MIRWDTVESSNINMVGYDAELEELHVKFNSGTEYVYSGVGAEVYGGLMRAPSKGKFLAAEIKGKYEYQRI
ncbi:hypothetical protein ES708_22237 [subsurface metagenome]